MNNIIQFKLMSGEEVLCEVVEWDDDTAATMVIKNAFEICFLQSPGSTMRLCTLRPFMVGQIQEGSTIALNADLIAAQANPSREILDNYRDTLQEYVKYFDGPTDKDLDEIEKEMDEITESENVLRFAPVDKDKMH